jgi:hypothetical protein
MIAGPAESSYAGIGRVETRIEYLREWRERDSNPQAHGSHRMRRGGHHARVCRFHHPAKGMIGPDRAEEKPSGVRHPDGFSIHTCL